MNSCTLVLYKVIGLQLGPSHGKIALYITVTATVRRAQRPDLQTRKPKHFYKLPIISNPRKGYVSSSRDANFNRPCPTAVDRSKTRSPGSEYHLEESSRCWIYTRSSCDGKSGVDLERPSHIREATMSIHDPVNQFETYLSRSIRLLT